MRHLITALDLSTEEISALFTLALYYRRNPEGSHYSMRGLRFASLFYEPSTRTRLSLEAAALALGMSGVSSENAGEFSSAAKGETLEDTLRCVSPLVHVIFVRHPISGSIGNAAKFSSVPIINAGDGSNEHPTQALLDLFTIWHQFGGPRTAPLRFQFLGDNLKSRTVRSLIQLIGVHGKALGLPVKHIDFTGPDGFREPDESLQRFMRSHGIRFRIRGESPRPTTDILYVTRPQKERDEEERPPYPAACRIDLEFARRMPTGSVIMHPLPRTEELAMNTDGNARAIYFEQAKNGLFVRMALIDMLIER